MTSQKRRSGGAYRRNEQLSSLYAKEGKDRPKAKKKKNRKRK